MVFSPVGKTGMITAYDHKVRLVRDLSCGDTRVYLEIPIRRVRKSRV